MLRTVQHKKEAYWFYRFLSIFYDNYVNPFFWTSQMRTESLHLAKLTRADLLTIDVGSGTGFTTQGIVQQIDAKKVTCIDQSPHQMAHAKKKEDLTDCTFNLGDAENLPYPTDHFDRYVSAGSVEYWPDPGRGIAEAFRVIKPGGTALLIGPGGNRSRSANSADDTFQAGHLCFASVDWLPCRFLIYSHRTLRLFAHTQTIITVKGLLACENPRTEPQYPGVLRCLLRTVGKYLGRAHAPRLLWGRWNRKQRPLPGAARSD
jgi:SAM-dependent methyltransferase